MLAKRHTMLLVLGIGLLFLSGCPKETSKAISENIQAKKPIAKSLDASMGGLAGKWRVTKIAYNALPVNANFSLTFGEGSVLAKLCRSFKVEVKTDGGDFSQGARPDENYGEGIEHCTHEISTAERNFIYAFERAVRFKIEKNILHLMSGDTVLVSAERTIKSEIDGNWKVLQLAGKTLPKKAMFTLSIQDETFIVKTCTALTGNIDTKEGRFSISKLETHLEALPCNKAMLATERQFIDAFQRTQRFEINDQGKLSLMIDKSVLITAKRVE